MGAQVIQLPRGRHRLTREQVLASQRGRLLKAIAEAVAEKGFAWVTVADVTTRAGVSRETFYEQFADKEDCFLAALDAGAEGLLQILRQAAGAPAPDAGERLERILDAYFQALAAQPALAKVFLIDAYGAGPRATKKRIELQQRFVDLLADTLGLRRRKERFACEAMVAAISSIATSRVGTGEADRLPDLRGPLADLAQRLLPEVVG
jgi:AcrR family transcriptional regulator